MTPKRVHFSETNIVYSPLPTPSPTFSEETLPSSDGPDTPSPIGGHRLLPATECESLPTAGPVRIHHTIGLDETPPIIWDLTLHPSCITTTAASTSSSLSGRPLSPLVLNQPATVPPLPALHLIADRFPWTVTIFAAESPDPCVTVDDVLFMFYRALRVPVAQGEFESLPSKEDKIMVTRAYESRFNAITELAMREEEARKGLKRVDFLMGKKFLGLSTTDIASDVWFVNVA